MHNVLHTADIALDDVQTALPNDVENVRKETENAETSPAGLGNKERGTPDSIQTLEMIGCVSSSFTKGGGVLEESMLPWQHAIIPIPLTLSIVA